MSLYLWPHDPKAAIPSEYKSLYKRLEKKYKWERWKSAFASVATWTLAMGLLGGEAWISAPVILAAFYRELSSINQKLFYLRSILLHPGNKEWLTGQAFPPIDIADTPWYHGVLYRDFPLEAVVRDIYKD